MGAVTEEILTAQEAARYLRLAANTVKRKAQNGEIPAAKIGRQWRFQKAELDKWLASGGDYERRVDRGLLALIEERAADPGDQENVPWEKVKAALGL